MSWNCPYAEKSQYFENRLMCKKCKKDGVNYAEPKNFVSAMCLYQKFCNCKNKYLNTEMAQKCYEAKSNNNQP